MDDSPLRTPHFYEGVVNCDAEEETQDFAEAILDAECGEKADGHHRREERDRPIEWRARQIPASRYVPRYPQYGQHPYDQRPPLAWKEEQGREKCQPQQLAAHDPLRDPSH